ncbi:MAG: hypothetical protein MJ132_07035 [Clostridia bacterium]|nr:hypothetical protein [Clostridia bacterium]
MNSDQDIKIVGDRPSEDVRRNRQQQEEQMAKALPDNRAAKLLGERIARFFIEDAKSAEQDSAVNMDMMIQRRLLLSFTATVCFEQYCKSDELGGVAQKSFLNALKNEDAELYRTSSDTGAFSFYYLAFRRGGDIERRMGQTFAMLCSHDGDPIFQELGEALYCWFTAEVRKAAKELNLD